MHTALIFLRIGVATAIATALGCSSNRNETSNLTPTADIFSNRAIAVVPDLFMVTLPAPALLTTAKMTPAGLEINPADKLAVLNEQASFEQKLKAVAPQAQIVYRMRLTLNAVAVYAPPDVAAALNAISGVRAVAPARRMSRPQVETVKSAPFLSSSTNSVNFIGAEKAHALGFTGQGLRIGVIDSGVDYTHKMLGGSGVKADFGAVNPDLPTAAFPNAKVVGGWDLVGTTYDSASAFPHDRQPKPDGNPIDEDGHGTHVAGTIAGHGNGTHTYSGVAPDASIFAIKVFGKEGETSDAVVMAAFEYAVDPNSDLDPKDRLDVVNLSLGDSFGQPQILYSEAIRNTTRAGTIVVASAGNSGDTDYIVGAPSTATEAFSVAASIDGSPHNWQFGAVRFTAISGESFVSKAVEGSISKPIKDIGPLEGPLHFIGFADQDLTPEQQAELKGKVALIQRGKVPFGEKLKRAFDGGAIGAVVINNEPGDRTLAMGGQGKFDIPAIMVGQDTGVRILSEIKQGEVKIQFKNQDKIFEPEVIDTITDFSSKGPRSEDNLFKPEISAPGASVISAAMGEGVAGVPMNGTSMAAPHMAGVMALLRQAFPNLSPQELKSLAMNTAKVLRDEDEDIPLTLQGAGRVQVDQAVTASLALLPSALSLGLVQFGSSRAARHTVTVKNISTADLTLTLSTKADSGLRLTTPGQLTVAAGGSATFVVESEVSMVDEESGELDGRIVFTAGGKTVAHLPALAMSAQASLIRGQTPSADKINLLNSSPQNGKALAFNLIGEDERKAQGATFESWKNRSCDLQSVGYRILTKANHEGVDTEYLQIAFKVHTPLTTWAQCEVSALVDADGDGIYDQELVGTRGEGLTGANIEEFTSALIDSKKAREMRLAFEKAVADGEKDPKEDYAPSLITTSEMMAFPHSTVAVIETPLALVAKGSDGAFHLKFAAQSGMGNDDIEDDDYLGGGGLGEWKAIAGTVEGQAYTELPETLDLKGRGQQVLNLKRGTGQGKLVLFYPNNELSASGQDNQSQIY
jgi:subtilisin family serine protease